LYWNIFPSRILEVEFEKTGLFLTFVICLEENRTLISAFS